MAKAAAYWATRTYREAYDMHVCSGLLSNHDSPLRPPRFVCKKIVATAVRIAKGSSEKLQLGNVNIQRDWGLAAEYVDAMHQMLQQSSPDDYIIATGETNSLGEFIEATFSTLGLDADKHVEINSRLYRPLDLPISRLSPAKAQVRLGWTAKTKMRDLAKLLVRCELDGTVGPLPWTSY
jgi:GDPmannose 4,6-dehydratase